MPHVPPARIPPELLKIAEDPRLQFADKEKLLAIVRAVAQGYVSVGPLTYRRPGMGLATDLSADEEKVLAIAREALLVIAGPALIKNHSSSNYIKMFDKIQKTSIVEKTAEEAIRTAKDLTKRGAAAVLGQVKTVRALFGGS